MACAFIQSNVEQTKNSWYANGCAYFCVPDMLLALTDIILHWNYAPGSTNTRYLYISMKMCRYGGMANAP